MKILHLETGRYLYGGALQVQYLIRGLANKGVENVLVCSSNSELSRQINEDNIEIVALAMRGDADLSFIFRFKKLIHEHNADLVHLHSRRGADTLGLLAAKWSNTPVVISRRVDNKETRLASRLKYNRCDRVITISRKIKDVLLNQDVAADRLRLVYSAVDTDKFSPLENVAWFQQEFGIEKGEKVIGMIAQMIKRKGHSTLFCSLEKARSSLPKCKVLIFGQGPLQTELQAEVKARSISDIVRFVGFRHDLHKIIPNLDLLVHPAFAEGLGVAILQANSCGVPVIAANAGGLPEIIQHNYNGWLFKPGNSEQLATLLAHALSDDIAIEKIRQRCRDAILSKFSIESMVDGNLAVYNEVLL